MHDETISLVRLARVGAIDLIAGEDIVDPDDGESAEAWETIERLVAALEPFSRIPNEDGSPWEPPTPPSSPDEDDGA